MKKLLIMVLAAFAIPVSAANLDFTEVASGYQGGNSVNLSNATVTTNGADIFVASPHTYSPSVGPYGGFCGVTVLSGFDCSTVSTIDFNNEVSNLSFNTTAYGSGDVLTASIFGSGGLISSLNIAAATLVDFTAFTGITKLVLDGSNSTAWGLVYGNFSFDENLSPVPVPAAAWLFGSALLGLVGIRRRKLKSA